MSEDSALGKSLELFVGAGGMALGAAQAGFKHVAVLDWNANACRTLLANQARGVPLVRDWQIIQGDVSRHQFQQYADNIDVVFAGPPCQPFSIGGRHLGHEDERNMFPQAVRAIREIRPKAFVLENVKGLLRASFANYYNYIIHQLRFPDIGRGPGEDWRGHLARLERTFTGGRHPGLHYNVVYECHNAADFGVPQRRERVFVVGIRSDLGLQFSFPQATHACAALLRDKWITGEYWDRHRVARSKRPRPSATMRRQAELMELSPEAPKAWRTVRDAISDLPFLEPGETSPIVFNHFLNPGARSYPGHDGSAWDEPAKTLKAGDHGVPGGENSVRLDEGGIRYFSVRECARLQSFPDNWLFEGSWTEAMRQLGNAVPVHLATAIANRLSKTLRKKYR